MNEFDNRQLNLMLQKIHAFNEGHLYFSELINDLEALVNVLENQDQHWKDLFIGYWWDLEQVYAFALDEEREYLNAEEERIVTEAIMNLEKLVSNKLNSKQELGKAIKDELNKGYDIKKISNWAYDLSTSLKCKPSSELDTILDRIFIITADKEFEYTEQELKLLAELLINDAKDPLKQVDDMKSARLNSFNPASQWLCIPMKDLLLHENSFIWLLKWYYDHCNGDWEHGKGIHIDSIDNPGWSI